MIDEYLKAKKAGEKEYRAKSAKGEDPYLPSLDDILPGSDVLSQKHLGLMEIPVEQIAGTRTRARQNSFASNFMPLLGTDTEFAMKWSNLYTAQENEGFNDPIKVYEYLHRFYVIEGNKRVSVSRFLDMPSIMADVTRIMPSAEVLKENPVYAEFLDFYKAVPVYDILCSRPGSYKGIAELAGNGLGKSWSEEQVKALKTGYWYFTRATAEFIEKVPGMMMGDAFLVYLKAFRGDAIGGMNEKQVGKRVKRIRKEIYTAHNRDKVALVESSDDALNAGSLITKAEKIVTGPGSLVSKVIPAITYTEKHPLKAAFIYSKLPEDSNWVYNHEEGRKRLEAAYGGIVKTERFVALSECGRRRHEEKAARSGKACPEGTEKHRNDKVFASFDDAVAAAVKWGADVVFTAAVQHSDDTLRAAIRYEDVKFLNCSINIGHQAVRTYYAKLYEAKFLAGIVAGAASAADGTHKIGYCSDYPIYGTIAGINAFAIGAAMVDPQVKIYLDWSARQDNNWWWNMVDQGIHVLSVIDSTHNTDGTNVYGVCYVEETEPGKGTDLSGRCRITNLASPIWKWGKLYELIVRTIIDGTYHASLVDKKDQATNYWWGMMSGVVDIELSDAVPVYTRQLVNILRTDIICGAMNPFDGELHSQTGLVRNADDKPLTSMDVITMNWLNENVIGEIPDREALTEEGKETVSVSGVK